MFGGKGSSGSAISSLLGKITPVTMVTMVDKEEEEEEERANFRKSVSLDESTNGHPAVSVHRTSSLKTYRKPKFPPGVPRLDQFDVKTNPGGVPGAGVKIWRAGLRRLDSPREITRRMCRIGGGFRRTASVTSSARSSSVVDPLEGSDEDWSVRRGEKKLNIKNFRSKVASVLLSRNFRKKKSVAVNVNLRIELNRGWTFFHFGCYNAIRVLVNAPFRSVT